MLEQEITPRPQLTPLALYGWIGLLLSAWFHAESLTGKSILSSSDPLFFGMHAAIFPLFFAFVFKLQPWRVKSGGWFGARGLLNWRQLRPYFPRWAPLLAQALVIYAFINFFAATGALEQFTSGARGSTLSPDQAVRAFSGHWMLFYTLPALYFTYVPSDARPPSTDQMT